jgi:hypothetical protein
MFMCILQITVDQSMAIIMINEVSVNVQVTMRET